MKADEIQKIPTQSQFLLRSSRITHFEVDQTELTEVMASTVLNISWFHGFMFQPQASNRRTWATSSKMTSDAAARSPSMLSLPRRSSSRWPWQGSFLRDLQWTNHVVNPRKDAWERLGMVNRMVYCWVYPLVGMASHWVYHINEIRCKTCFWNLGTWVRPVNLTLARSHSYHGSRHQGIHQPEMQTRDQWPKTGKHQKQSALSNFDPTEDTTWPFK